MTGSSGIDPARPEKLRQLLGPRTSHAGPSTGKSERKGRRREGRAGTIDRTEPAVVLAVLFHLVLFFRAVVRAGEFDASEIFGGRMIVGVAVVELHVHESQSLKAKRGVIRSIVGRLRNRFNVSVAEVGGQGTWQRAVIGLSMTGSEEIPLRRALEKAVTAIEQMHLAEVLASEIEIIRLPISEQGHLPDGEEEDLPWSSGLGERKIGEEE